MPHGVPAIGDTVYTYGLPELAAADTYGVGITSKPFLLIGTLVDGPGSKFFVMVEQPGYFNASDGRLPYLLYDFSGPLLWALTQEEAREKYLSSLKDISTQALKHMSTKLLEVSGTC